MPHLYQNWYVDADANRQDEISFCLLQNLDSSYGKIFLIGEDCPSHPKITSIETAERPTFKTFFDLANKINHNGINILANTDIFIPNESLELIKQFYEKRHEVMVLTRWEQESNSQVVGQDSQDVWIWRGQIECEADFYLGILGCDNRIADMLSQKYVVINPSLDIKAYHVHASNIRRYDINVSIPPPYKHVQPTNLEI